jgi:hypothetical protein
VEQYLETNGSSLGNQEQAPGLHLLAAALAGLATENPKSDFKNEPDPYSPWKIASSFRIGGSHG